MRIQDPLAGALDNTSQASPDPIAHDRIAQPLRGDETEAERFPQRLVREITQNQEAALNGLAPGTDALKIAPIGDPPGARELHDPVIGRDSRSDGQTAKTVSEKTGLPAVLDGVALEVDLCALRNKALTTLLATAFDQVTTRFGGHASTEAVLVFAGTL